MCADAQAQGVVTDLNMSSTATIETLYTATDLSAAELDHADWDRVKATPLTRYWSGNPLLPTGTPKLGSSGPMNRFVCVLFAARRNP